MRKAIAGIVLVILAMLSLLVVIYQQVQKVPPLRYVVSETDTRITETFKANKNVYLPGETLVYTPTLIRQKRGRVDVSRAFYDVTRDKSATLCDGSPSPQDTFWRMLPRGVYHNVRGGRQVRVDVPRLPPGDYLLQSSVVDPASGGEAYVEVPFSVREPC